jgi:hypothetical protein
MFENFKIWFKENEKKILFTLIIVLTIALSFGLGFLLGKSSKITPIIIEKNSK